MRALLALLASLAATAALAGTYAAIDPSGRVSNIVVWDGSSPYSAGPGTSLVPYAAPAGIGSIWDGHAFSAPPAASPAVPAAVTRRQARLALNAAGLLAKVEQAIAAADVPTQIWYGDSDTWDRQDPHVLAMAATLGLTAAQVDGLFVQAAGM